MTTANPGRSPPAARHYGYLALGYLLFVIYGSLAPLHFQPIPFEEALRRAHEAFSAPIRLESRSDWAANILLFIPLAFLFMGALTVDRGPLARLTAAVLVLAGGVLLSSAIEFTQLYFPPRVTSLNDVAAESTGAAAGIVLWLCVGQRSTLRLRRSGVGRIGSGAAAQLLVLYFLYVVFCRTLPLDLTLSPVEVYHKYRDGLVVAVPFTGRLDAPLMKVHKALTNFAYFLPLGWLLSRLPSLIRRQAGWVRILGLGVLLAGCVESMRLFVLSRSCDSTNVLTGTLAVVVGWRVGRGVGGAIQGVLLLLWIAVLCYLHWHPFDFHPGLAEAMKRLHEVIWLPFEDYRQGEYLNSFGQILEKPLLFAPLGGVLAAPWGGRRLHLFAAVAISAAIAIVLEAGQLGLPTRYASITDVLLGTVGTAIGFVVVRRLPPQSGPAPRSSRGIIMSG
jgi:glycopeptide antibiotics resistance protein